MKNWNTLNVGHTADVVDDGEDVMVRRDGDGLFVVLRRFDGSDQSTVWVRRDDTGWGVNRPEHIRKESLEDLSAAVEFGILLSREALNKYKPQASH
ncbi:hypothetical protein [Clavibacter michiganensis]|uniref:hypothetical protein n=1 Tax=Clavibacter michiganensis TaxID=28447 RepID=UPI00117846C4|nr:hypothetical protein [Clavibacter michiganensis]